VVVELAGPVKRGDGLVFDRGLVRPPRPTVVGAFVANRLQSPSLPIATSIVATSIQTQPEEAEEGGAVYEVWDPKGRPVAKGAETDHGTATLFFARGAVAWARVRP
jgi:hypothetical protein